MRAEPETTKSADTIAPIREQMTHDFNSPEEEVRVLVQQEQVVEVTMWFEGVFAPPSEPLSIQLRSPEGEVALETSSPANFVGGAVGGRSYEVSKEITLTAGDWTVAFSGKGAPTGHLVME